MAGVQTHTSVPINVFRNLVEGPSRTAADWRALSLFHRNLGDRNRNFLALNPTRLNPPNTYKKCGKKQSWLFASSFALCQINARKEGRRRPTTEP